MPRKLWPYGPSKLVQSGICRRSMRLHGRHRRCYKGKRLLHAARSFKGVEPPRRIMLNRRTEKDKAMATYLERKIAKCRSSLFLALEKSCWAERYNDARRPSLHHC